MNEPTDWRAAFAQCQSELAKQRQLSDLIAELYGMANMRQQRILQLEAENEELRAALSTDGDPSANGAALSHLDIPTS